MKPSFSELREYLLVQKKVFEDDEFGGQIKHWVDLKKVWSHVEFASSKDITHRPIKDLFKGDTPLRKSLYRVSVRLDNDLPEHIRFKRDNNFLQVIAAPFKEGGYMTFYTYEEGEVND